MVLRLLLPTLRAGDDPDHAVRSASVRRASIDEVDAALVIHEGRLTFEREGFACVCDIGEAMERIRLRCRSA